MSKNKRVILNLIKIDLEKYLLSYKWFIVIILFFLVNYFSNLELYKISKGFNIWDVIYNTLINQYHILYFFTPVLLWITIPAVLSNFNPYCLTRIIHADKWLVSKFIFIHIISIIFTLMGLTISVIGSLSSSIIENRWSMGAQNFITVSKEVVLTFKHPPIAILFGIILLILGWSSITIVYLVIYLSTNKKILALISISVIWVSGLIGIRSLSEIPNEFAYLLFNTNLLLSQTMLMSKKGFIISIIFWTILNSILFFFGKYSILSNVPYDKRKNNEI